MQPSHEPLDLVPVLEDGLPMGVPLMAALGLQSLLQGAGIEAQLSGFRAEPVLPFHLLVSSQQVEEAGRIIAEAKAAGYGAADAAELEGEALGEQPPDDVNSGLPGIL